MSSALDMRRDIKNRRLERGFSQAGLAKAMTINSIETEKYTASLPLALALGRFFQIPIAEMFDADE